MTPKYKVGQQINDKYGRHYKIVEARVRESEQGEEYAIYNLYPVGVKPVPVQREDLKANGWKYETYLFTLEEDLLKILVSVN